jgi:hypothetical protein
MRVVGWGIVRSGMGSVRPGGVAGTCLRTCRPVTEDVQDAGSGCNDICLGHRNRQIDQRDQEIDDGNG